MIDFKDIMNKELAKLKNEKALLEKLYPNDDGYFLEVKKNKGKYMQFYKCKMLEDGGRGKVQRNFIKKEDIGIARRLAQRDFDIQILKMLDEQIAALEIAIQSYPSFNGKMLFNSLSDTRKALVDSKYKDDARYISDWKGAFAGEEGNAFKEKYPIETPYYTDNGEHVRSKSEKIIADKLAKEKVPYVYEPSCELNRKGLHPDFALLNVATRETFYYEHFGMMDKPEYATAAVRKIEKYRELGYEYGKNLLYTFETGADGLSVKAITAIINDYL